MPELCIRASLLQGMLTSASARDYVSAQKWDLPAVSLVLQKTYVCCGQLIALLHFQVKSGLPAIAGCNGLGELGTCMNGYSCFVYAWHPMSDGGEW